MWSSTVIGENLLDVYTKDADNSDFDQIDIQVDYKNNTSKEKIIDSTEDYNFKLDFKKIII